jgi:alpha-D-ribose 1-methylphosphonate 5-triphosphate synthase subunit PhnH
MIDQIETPLAAGFTDPVHGAHTVFRAVMQAMARPGTVVSLPSALAAPSPLPPELAAIALALADFETPIWVDAALHAAPDAVRYLRFHTGARLVERPDTATFALIADPTDMPDLETFAQGTLEYPDRSTTLVLRVSELEGGTPLRLKGPGIRDTIKIAPHPVPQGLGAQMIANRARFPRGVDLILTTPGAIAALPRSVTLLS